ncbi:glycosyl transferase family protein [Salinarchaeum sp. Harcht-Bsk1]|uniref:glycosyltransferase n=1 Tax=Salinarchaeum sp. Harcht-Bsk1 TaxID=1333523 RepID=UPI0003422ACB|nr:glycosyltransferase [Salinarchaeum sp. Harcht-Bsk1]AGN00935.1 glycosyl transferase family protein [Salinarchaeum sp. Harcht-Bsk1]
MNLLVAATVGMLAVAAVPYVLYLGFYALIRPSGSPANKEAQEPTLSIVLPTFNEERIVEGKLERICSLDYPMDKVEVVVVDASDDETPDRIRDFFANRESPELTLIEEETRRGLALALNDAYAAASNEVVVKTDCDSEVADGALREAVANLADPHVAAVTGRNAEVLGGSDVESGYRGVQSYIQTLESHLDSTLIFHGPFSAFENDAIVPIDEDSIADDTELALKIRRGGQRVLFDPAIRYREAAHSAFRKRRKQKDRRAMGLLRLLVRNRDALGRYGRYGRVVLPFNWWFMIVSPWLLAATLLTGTVAGVSVFGPAGLVLPLAVGGFVFAGSRDMLGPLQALYAVFDTQVSLLRAAIKLLAGKGSAVWEIDSELREAYE